MSHAGGGASAVDKTPRRKNKASAPKEPKKKVEGKKEEKKKRSRGKGGDDQEERGRFSRFEAVALEVRERARMWMLARAAGGWGVVGGGGERVFVCDFIGGKREAVCDLICAGKRRGERC